MTDLCTGWIPHAENAVKLKFSAYANVAKLPQIPDNFGHEPDSSFDWQMCLNDKAGVCVVAGGAHETKLACHIGGKPIPTFTDTDIAEDFRAITGLPPNPVTGADMKTAASYRLKTGLRDSTGTRHKIGAYLELRAGDLQELYAAMYISDGMVGCGLRFYNEWFDMFRNHQAWRIVSGMTPTLMGHYVPLMALRGNLVGVSWARYVPIRPSVYPAACQQALVYLSPEALIEQRSPEGFAWGDLLQDMNVLAGG